MQTTNSETSWSSNWLWDIWGSSQQSLESSAELGSSTIAASTATVQSLVDERLGCAKVVGKVVLPSQWICPPLKECEEILRDAIARPPAGVSRIEEVQIGEVRGVILYPTGYQPEHKTECVLYHNPNGCTVTEFLARFTGSTPSTVLELHQCPLFMYDYRGSGLSREEPVFLSSMDMQNTHASVTTITQDGLAALQYVMGIFPKVIVWGSSLGGGVGAVTTAEYLRTHASNASRLVAVYNHDSFTTTGQVALSWPLNYFAWLVGGEIDAATAMRSLCDRNVKLIILCHDNDPVIPKGARMANIAIKLGATVINSPYYGHAHLSDDMIATLKRLP